MDVDYLLFLKVSSAWAIDVVVLLLSATQAVTASRLDTDLINAAFSFSWVGLPACMCIPHGTEGLEGGAVQVPSTAAVSCEMIAMKRVDF